MKKKIFVLAAYLMLFAGVGSAFADTPAPADSTNGIAVTQTLPEIAKLQVLKEYRDELHKINSLREERLGLKTQIVQKQDHILDLVIQAADNHNQEALKEAGLVRKQIQALNNDMQALRQSMASEMKDFRQSVKAGDKVQAQAHINHIITLFEEANGKLGQKIILLDQIIAILGN